MLRHLARYIGDRGFMVLFTPCWGIAAESLGIFITMVVGTKLVPEKLRFHNWKRWMRAELLLWWTTLLSGVATYYMWYGARFR
jgi:hypothetical protein